VQQAPQLKQPRAGVVSSVEVSSRREGPNAATGIGSPQSESMRDPLGRPNLEGENYMEQQSIYHGYPADPDHQHRLAQQQAQLEQQQQQLQQLQQLQQQAHQVLGDARRSGIKQPAQRKKRAKKDEKKKKEGCYRVGGFVIRIRILMYHDVSCVYPEGCMYPSCILMYLKCILNALLHSKRIHVS